MFCYIVHDIEGKSTKRTVCHRSNVEHSMVGTKIPLGSLVQLYSFINSRHSRNLFQILHVRHVDGVYGPLYYLKLHYWRALASF